MITSNYIVFIVILVIYLQRGTEISPLLPLPLSLSLCVCVCVSVCLSVCRSKPHLSSSSSSPSSFSHFLLSSRCRMYTIAYMMYSRSFLNSKFHEGAYRFIQGGALCVYLIQNKIIFIITRYFNINKIHKSFLQRSSIVLLVPLV